MPSYLKIFLSILLIILPLSLHSETHVSGYVSGVWGPEGNPYIADSSLVIASGDTLQMLPGVEIILNRARKLGITKISTTELL